MFGGVYLGQVYFGESYPLTVATVSGSGRCFARSAAIAATSASGFAKSSIFCRSIARGSTQSSITVSASCLAGSSSRSAIAGLGKASMKAIASSVISVVHRGNGITATVVLCESTVTSKAVAVSPASGRGLSSSKTASSCRATGAAATRAYAGSTTYFNVHSPVYGAAKTFGTCTARGRIAIAAYAAGATISSSGSRARSAGYLPFDHPLVIRFDLERWNIEGPLSVLIAAGQMTNMVTETVAQVLELQTNSAPIQSRADLQLTDTEG